MKQLVKISGLMIALLICVRIFAFYANGSKQKSERREDNQQDSLIFATSFQFPVGPPNGHGYYNAQKFGENNHLGDDWNADTGGNTDLGDTVYAIANGTVSFAEDVKGGWGNVIRIIHVLPEGKKVESLYAHCDEILITKDQQVKIGEPIGTIGNAHGIYFAHLHLEIRDIVGLPLGGGYSNNTDGYVDPTHFIKNH